MKHSNKILIILFSLVSSILACLPVKKSSLILGINTIEQDTFSFINATFYTYDKKLVKHENWKFLKNLKETNNFQNVKPDSFNYFNFKGLKKGKYIVILYFTLNNRRHSHKIDTIPIEKGLNTTNKILTITENEISY